LQRVLLLLGWPSEEAADDPGGRLQHQEEHPQQEGADPADDRLAISRPEQEPRTVRAKSKRKNLPPARTEKSKLCSAPESKNQSEPSFQEQGPCLAAPLGKEVKRPANAYQEAAHAEEEEEEEDRRLLGLGGN
jgi:hypothetical protein